MSYNWDGMEKITFAEAKERIDANKSVFLLYDDDTEAEADSIDDLIRHNKYFGEFGYEKH